MSEAKDQPGISGIWPDGGRAAAIKGRATASQLLGAFRPITQSSFASAGAMFGSAVGYNSGQYYHRGLTILAPE